VWELQDAVVCDARRDWIIKSTVLLSRLGGSDDMKPPLITATYVAILALLYTVLSLQVVRLRSRNRVGFGDGENTALRCAIRAHAHFAEYVPIIALMAAMLEMSGLPATRIHMLMGSLLVARFLHPLGIYAKPGTLQFSIGRVGGMVITITVMVSCALLILRRILFGG
jgi:uncharacterized protein